MCRWVFVFSWTTPLRIPILKRVETPPLVQSTLPVDPTRVEWVSLCSRTGFLPFRSLLSVCSNVTYLRKPFWISTSSLFWHIKKVTKSGSDPSELHVWSTHVGTVWQYTLSLPRTEPPWCGNHIGSRWEPFPPRPPNGGNQVQSTPLQRGPFIGSISDLLSLWV